MSFESLHLSDGSAANIVSSILYGSERRGHCCLPRNVFVSESRFIALFARKRKSHGKAHFAILKISNIVYD